MTPPTRSSRRNKQQDVRSEVDQVQVNRGPPVRRRSSRLQKLSLAEAPTHLNPSSGIYLHIFPIFLFVYLIALFQAKNQKEVRPTFQERFRSRHRPSV